MHRRRIILVEDDEALLELLAVALREHYAVWVARDGTHALEVAAELDWDADALLVDLALGEGPRGDQFVAYYRTRQKRKTPVIVISGASAPMSSRDR
jgi:DNA-binding response OmpR family regulator